MTAIKIEPIHTEQDYQASLSAAEAYWGAPEGSPENKALGVLSVLIEDFEIRQWPIAPPDPIDYLWAHMEEFGLRPADLGRIIGSAPHATEVLQRRRPLSLNMIRAIHEAWLIQFDVLARSYDVNPEHQQVARIVATAKRAVTRRTAAKKAAPKKLAAKKTITKKAAPKKAIAKKAAPKWAVAKKTVNAKRSVARRAPRKSA